MAWTQSLTLLGYIFLIIKFNEINCHSDSGSVYHNEFAVHIPDGSSAADEIAAKYGYDNTGQIGSLENYFLFRHRRLRKRSIEPAQDHHLQLISDPKVTWAEQQIEKRRFKRDFASEDEEEKMMESSSSNRNSRQFFQGPFATGFGGFSFLNRPFHLTPIQRGSRVVRFTDPLFASQWYLVGGSTNGYDMNVEPAWNKGYTGKGVVVSILDDGIQHNHPDLKQNYDPLASTDINDNDADPMPRDNGDNKHGTRCAGEVASVAYNNYCGVGIAYNASIGGVRMLDGTVNDAVEARAISLNPDHVDIYSASWGPEDDGKTVDGPGPLAKRAFINGVLRGRHGKGSIFVWASGNGGRHTDNCNCDGYTNSIFTLSISSASQRGNKPWYLEECSSTLATTYSSGSPGFDRSITTADMDGAMRYEKMCTSEHTGTSASAPLAAGICALALEANPDLTWRDMQHIVVSTSRYLPLAADGHWFPNGVGRNVSHRFGYGLMDAGAMVDLAEKWTRVPPQHVCQSVVDNRYSTIPGTSGGSVVREIITDGCRGHTSEVRYLEHVQAVVSLKFLPRGSINIKLVSPSDTVSTLLFERPRDTLSEKIDDWPFLSVHFWGENPVGTWKLIVKNGGPREFNKPGVLHKWQLILHGTKEPPERLRSRSNIGHIQNNPFVDNFFSGSANHEQTDTLNSEEFHDDKDNGLSSKKNRKDSSKFYSTEACHSECLGGCSSPGPENCRECLHFSLQGECVSTCPSGTYGSEDKLCLSCHGSCSDCVGPRQNQCSACPYPSLFVSHLGICIDSCPSGYYASDGSCLLCGNQCDQCDNNVTCSQCDHNLLLANGTCGTVCAPGYYESQTYTCELCHPTCSTCVGGDLEDCATCQLPFFLSKGRCVRDCPHGEFGHHFYRECIVCPTGCDSCDQKVCTACEEGWRIKAGRCVASKSDKCNFNEETNCIQCHPSCLNCIGPSESHCLLCQVPMFLFNRKCIPSCPKGFFAQWGRCLPCAHGCEECLSYNNCTACDRRFYLKDNKCLPSCPKGYYSDLHKCRKCHSNCDSCWGPRRDQCLICSENFVLLDSSCYSKCPPGHYSENGVCQPCYHNCKTCDGAGLHSCTSCHDFLTLDGGMCLECRTGRYYNSSSKSCESCHDSCLTCTDRFDTGCTSCQAPLSLHPETRSCRICCPKDSDRRAFLSHLCCDCDPSTDKCLGSIKDDKRRIANPYLETQSNPAPTSVFSSTTSIVVIVCLVNIFIIAVGFGVYQIKKDQYAYKRIPIKYLFSGKGVELTEVSPSDSESETETEQTDLSMRI